MTAFPYVFAVTMPFSSTAATFSSEEVHVTLPSAPSGTALISSCCVCSVGISSGPSGGAEGWLKNGNEYRYRNSNGTWAKGWLQDGGKWYYLDKNGIMVTGSQTIGGKRYYFKPYMATNEYITVDSVEYYFDKDGIGHVV